MTLYFRILQERKLIVQVINEQDAKSAVLVGFYTNFCNFIQVLHMVAVKL